MPYKSFVIPALHAGWVERELNAFIGSHRVLSVDRHWVDQGQNSYWAVWVDYLDSPSGGALELVGLHIFRPDRCNHMSAQGRVKRR